MKKLTPQKLVISRKVDCLQMFIIMVGYFKNKLKNEQESVSAAHWFRIDRFDDFKM